MTQLDQFDQMADDINDLRNGIRAANIELGHLHLVRHVLTDLVKRLMTEHRRTPHHADTCSLCMNADAAIKLAEGSAPPLPPRTP